jgi:hypothetical protein
MIEIPRVDRPHQAGRSKRWVKVKRAVRFPQPHRPLFGRFARDQDRLGGCGVVFNWIACRLSPPAEPERVAPVSASQSGPVHALVH